MNPKKSRSAIDNEKGNTFFIKFLVRFARSQCSGQIYETCKGKLLSEKDVVGPTHVYSFKSGVIFDQGGNKREIARLNGNKKQHILCKSRPEGVQKRFATCHHGWVILPGLGLPSLPRQGEFYKWQNFSTPAVRRFCQTQRRLPRQINARSVIICQTFAVIGFGCRFRCHS